MLHQSDLKQHQLPRQIMANGKVPGVTFTPEEIKEMLDGAVKEATLEAILMPFDADEARARVKAGQIITDPTPEQRDFSNMVGEIMNFDVDAARTRLRAQRGHKPKLG